MKKLIIILIYVISFNTLQAQHIQNTKADYQWLMGYHYNLDWRDWHFDFNKKPMQYLLRYKTLAGDLMTANVCDKSGGLAFYTNGCKIADGQDAIIQGGDTLNAGYGYNARCKTDGFGYASSQGAIILPSLTDDTSFYAFHLRIDYAFDSRIGGIGTDKLLMSKIIKAKGKYKVNFRDYTLLYYQRDSAFMDGQLTACRHANGRDWWIIMPKLFENAYHILLFTPYGIEKKVQKIGAFRILAESGGGMAVFSPDGQKYIEYGGLSGAKIYDFNRCSGELSNYRNIDSNPNGQTFAGCVVSSNSRFLYLAYRSTLSQFDLWSDSIQSTKYIFKVDSTVVDTTQGLPLYTLFWTCQLGADGKIYIASTGGRKYMHVIDKPDLKGAACELKQNGITLPVYITWAIPFFPNFRLGPLKGSPCDTLSTTPMQEINKIRQLSIYPNPAQELIKVDMTLDDYGELEKCQLRVVDIVGKVHQTHPLSNYASIKEISVANLANGLYFVQLVDKQGFLIANSKVVVAR